MALLTPTIVLNPSDICEHKHWMSQNDQSPWMLWRRGSNQISKITYGMCLECQELVLLEDKVVV